jgi:nitrogen regulatory protein P-II 1
MKEIKAYIRRDQVNQVAERLCEAGAPGVSIIEIHPLGYGYESNPFAPHAAKFIDRYSYLTIVKLELMCTDAQVESLLQVIREQCSTRSPGDGMIFVSDIVDVMRIKDGLRGESALGAGGPRMSGVARRLSTPT